MARARWELLKVKVVASEVKVKGQCKRVYVLHWYLVRRRMSIDCRP